MDKKCDRCGEKAEVICLTDYEVGTLVFKVVCKCTEGEVRKTRKEAFVSWTAAQNK